MELCFVSKNHKLEITTLRKDISTDGRHAEVGTLMIGNDSEEDFTINAIYLDINGNIFDPQMGTTDLENNNVKFIGVHKRIEERCYALYDLFVLK